MSQWFLPSDYGANSGTGDNGSVRQLRASRRICGLPLWAFIVLVILGLVIITAAVVVPLQLVNRDRSSAAQDSPVAKCRQSNPCQNGGENIATSGFCGCICTNGFTGASCTEKSADSSCTSFDFDGQQTANSSNSAAAGGIKNATIGSALPRLFGKADGSYNIPLDPSLVLATFSNASLSCTLQNALVNLTGRTTPQNSAARLRLRQLDIDPSPSPTPASAAASAVESLRAVLNQDVVDFARVAVLYVVQTVSVSAAEDAHQRLDDTFRVGRDSGNVTSSSGITFELAGRRILLAGGASVGRAN